MFPQIRCESSAEILKETTTIMAEEKHGEMKGEKRDKRGMGGNAVSDLDLLLKKVNFVLLLQELLLLSCDL